MKNKKLFAILTILSGFMVIIISFLAFSKKVPTGAVIVFAIIAVCFSVTYSKIK